MIPLVCRLGPAIRILRTVEPQGWPAAIAAIEDEEERSWADAWLRQHAQRVRLRRRLGQPESEPAPANRHASRARSDRRRAR